MAAAGIQGDRDYLSLMPFEHVDTMSGGLVLQFTDLVLPGNAGRELRFQRTYSSKTQAWTLAVAGYATGIDEPAAPPGGGSGPQFSTPTLVMSDGSRRSTAWLSGSNTNESITRDFWKYNRVTRTLYVPNGDVCSYELVTTGHLRIQSCEDAFGNVVSFAWSTIAGTPPHTQLVVTQYLTTTAPATTRVITLTYDEASGNPLSLQYGGKTWTYLPTSTTNRIAEVDLPGDAPGWLFAYVDGLTSTLTVTTPNSGTLVYTFEVEEYEGPEAPPVTYGTTVLTGRTANDGTNEGTWSFTYDFFSFTGVSLETTVETPSARLLYKHGWPELGQTPADPHESDPFALFDGEGGLTRLRERIVQRPDGGNWVDIEKVTFTYQWVPSLSWVAFGTLEPKSRTVTRIDGGTPTDYVTEFAYGSGNFGDYHHPNLITETGPAGTRVTNRTFTHLSARYILGLLENEKVTVGTEEFEKSWLYNVNDGFRTSETIYGIATEFVKTYFGNVGSAGTETNKVTSYTYQHGQTKTITTPKYTISRSINADGTVGSETIAGRTTSFTYDDIGRLRVTQPPGGIPATTIDYDTGGAWVSTTKGTSVTTDYLDGFGRTIESVNAVLVRSKTEYDAEGRVVHEGFPFRAGAPEGGDDTVGTTIVYDALGRVIQRVNDDDSSSSREYGPGGLVIIRDEENRATLQTWHAFGHPDDGRLVSMIDADSHGWSYTYNAVGSLLTVTGEGGVAGTPTVTRTWVFDTQNLLEKEVHPESGETKYYYDAAGVLVRMVENNASETLFTYDDNDRVRTITAGTRVTTITYEAGSDNRTSTMNGSAGVIWRYDLATGRLLARQDAIDGKLFTTAFEYDANDFLKAIQHPSGRRIQYQVNAEGQPTKVYEAAASRDYAKAIEYHPSGGVAAYYSGNDIATTISYDPSRYRIGNITSGPLGLTYTYDGVGNPLTIADSRGGSHDIGLTYDNVDRLTEAVGPQGTTTYSYDPHGNRTGTPYQYEPNKLRLSNQSGTAFTYDLNGNTATAGTAAYTYTPQNQLETATLPGILATFAYNADDQRVKKTSGGSTTYYIRGLNGELLTEWTDPGTASGRIRDYVYLGSRLLSAVARNSSEEPAGISQPPTPSHKYATSWQVPEGTGGNALIQSGTSAAARKSNHPDMPRTGLRLGVDSGTVDYLRNGPLFIGNMTGSPKQGGVFFEFEIERNPFTADAEILGTDGGGTGSSSTDDLRLYVTPGGQLVLKHDGARPTPQTLWTSAPIAPNTPHTFELRFEHNSGNGPYLTPNPAWENLTSWVQVYFDGTLVATYGASPGGTWDSQESNPYGLDLKNGLTSLVSIKFKSPAPAAGLLMNVWRVGVTTANHGEPMEQYGTSWRTTLLEAAGPGSHSQWTGGQPDWRARSAIAVAFTNPVTSNITGQKISYLMESMLARGITGNIGTVLVGVHMQVAASPNTRPFILRNGVETILSDMTLATNDFRWYRVASSGWSPTDVIEVGVTTGGNANNWLNSVALLVEHNTPEPEPLTDTSAQVVTVGYAGDGGAQTIDLGVDMWPTALFVVPLDGTGGHEPIWWWDSRQGAAPMSESLAGFGKIWPQKGKVHVVHQPSANTYNASGKDYVVIALFDPSGRYVIPFAVSKPINEDDYTHYLRKPQSGELASDFTPDFMFGGAAFGVTSDAVRASYYKGPGHAGDLTGKLGVNHASDADRIQALGPGTVQFGTLIYHSGGLGDHAFWAGRVDDGVSPTRLMAVTSYVGDGTASRNISLNLSGEAPVFAIVVPTSATAKVYRVAGDTTGRRTDTGNAVANSVTAMAPNQITVGLAMNAVGVTYDVWTITTGLVTP